MRDLQQTIYYRSALCQEVFKDVCQGLDLLFDRWWVDHGTLLGIYRDNELIEWDRDIDFGVLGLNQEKVDSLVGILKKRYFCVFFDATCNAIKIKMYDEKGFWSVDVAFYDYDEGYAWKLWPDFKKMGFFGRFLCFFLRSVCGDKSNYNSGFKGILVKIFNYLNPVSSWFFFLRKFIPFKKTIVPGLYFKELDQREWKGVSLYLPASVEGYLELRYGKSWGVKNDGWDYLSDDKTILD